MMGFIIYQTRYDTQQYYSYTHEDLAEGQYFEERINIAEIMLNDSDKAVATEVYNDIYNRCHLCGAGPEYLEFKNPTSGELFCSYYNTMVLGVEVLETPYDAYQSEQ